MVSGVTGEDKERVTEVVLRVEEARNRDARRKRVRIDLPTMRKLGVRPGDVVEIEGKKKTVAIVWPLLPEDMNKNIIRMDGILRKSAGVNVGDKVIVRKARVQPAIKVKLAPMNPSSPYDENFKNYMKKKLIGIPVVERDIVQVPVLGQAMPFTVVMTKPRGPVVITEKTIVEVLNKPVSATEVPRVFYEDIGGLSNVIARVRELIELPLRHPELFARLGIEPPKGVLLYGPPGTGKTLLAKAVATESDAYFIAINGPEIMSKERAEAEGDLQGGRGERAQHNLHRRDRRHSA